MLSGAWKGIVVTDKAIQFGQFLKLAKAIETQAIAPVFIQSKILQVARRMLTASEFA